MAIFGERLKQLRIDKGMSQDELGELIGYKRRMIYYLESGEREPNLETIRKLSELFNCTTDYLLGQTDQPDEKAVVTWRRVHEGLEAIADIIDYISEEYALKVRDVIKGFPLNDNQLTSKEEEVMTNLYKKMAPFMEEVDKKNNEIKNKNEDS